MIVFLAILNDGSILSIAYDNTRTAPEPLRWRMGWVMGMAVALGVFAVGRSLGLYFIATAVLGMHAGALMTMIYLNLSVGGILTLYAARARGPFWGVHPGRPLLLVTLAAQLIATVISVYGLLVTPIGWLNAGIVWVYCAALFLLQYRVKLIASRLFGGEHLWLPGGHAGVPAPSRH